MVLRRRFLLGLCGSHAATRLLLADSKGFGNPSAPIAMEVFSDFQCPACKLLYEGTLQPMKTEFVKTGKVFLIHRNFPLQMHPYAREAAGLAVGAERIGKYEPVATALFQKQETWSKNGRLVDALSGVLTLSELQKTQKIAKEPETLAEIERDIKLGKEVNVQQTPTIVLAHKKTKYPVSGIVSYSILQRFLNSLLAQ